MDPSAATLSIIAFIKHVQEFRRTMEEESVERIERIKREKMDFEEKLRKQNEDELRTMEKQHEEQLEKERMEGERKLQERKRKYAASQKKQQALQLDQMGQLDDAQRMEILKSFEDEQRRFLAMMSSERVSSEVDKRTVLVLLVLVLDRADERMILGCFLIGHTLL